MDFIIPKKLIQDNIINFMRNCGYFCLGRGNQDNELSFVRLIYNNNYPRFHAIIKSDMGKDFFVNIHLDQKKASYRGSLSHNADYDSPLVQDEADRIKNKLTNE